jgi:ketosteroid isomerase-like protein
MTDLRPEAVQQWLDRYLAAWRSNAPDQIGALFAEDATYAFSPVEPPARGRDAIVAAWLGHGDDPGEWETTVRPLLIDGDQAVIRGDTTYANGDHYENLWVLRLDDAGQCTEFTEWWVIHPAAPAPDPSA